MVYIYHVRFLLSAQSNYIFLLDWNIKVVLIKAILYTVSDILFEMNGLGIRLSRPYEGLPQIYRAKL